MILVHEQVVTEWYFNLKRGSDGAGKNEFLSQFTYLENSNPNPNPNPVSFLPKI